MTKRLEWNWCPLSTGQCPVKRKSLSILVCLLSPSVHFLLFCWKWSPMSFVNKLIWTNTNGQMVCLLTSSVHLFTYIVCPLIYLHRLSTYVFLSWWNENSHRSTRVAASLISRGVLRTHRPKSRFQTCICLIQKYAFVWYKNMHLFDINILTDLNLGFRHAFVWFKHISRRTFSTENNGLLWTQRIYFILFYFIYFI